MWSTSHRPGYPTQHVEPFVLNRGADPYIYAIRVERTLDCQTMLAQVLGEGQRHRAFHGDGVALLATLACPTADHGEPFAVEVKINGRLVGYLSDVDARAYRPVIKRLTARGRLVTCHALIVRKCRPTPAIGVYLDIAVPRDAL